MNMIPTREEGRDKALLTAHEFPEQPISSSNELATGGLRCASMITSEVVVVANPADDLGPNVSCLSIWSTPSLRRVTESRQPHRDVAGPNLCLSAAIDDDGTSFDLDPHG